MGKYCCFFCLPNVNKGNDLNDKCPHCKRSYGFVLDYPPAEIKEGESTQYIITQPLGRGFYGAAYLAEDPILMEEFVIKISPVGFYDPKHFNKNPFEEEVRSHIRLAKNAKHVVPIFRAFRKKIFFRGDDQNGIDCYVTVLAYVKGDPLKNFLNSTSSPRVASICQVVIDLLQLRAELEANQLYHNDLHSENLIVEKLDRNSLRHGEIDPTLRVMAIDLGSLSEESKSTDHRLGDLGYIAEHVIILLDKLIEQPDHIEDRDYRVALALRDIIGHLRANAQNHRFPNPAELIAKIREAFYRASHPWRPWSGPFTLKGFADHYNAQTLESWHVPKLLVDPDNRWLTKITCPGPQIITGMRGCGKTMLLRALDIHARAAQRENETPEAVIQRIQSDRFVGLYASAQRMLDLEENSLSIKHRLERLYVTYALQAARALMHLRDVDPGTIAQKAHERLASAIADCLKGANNLRECTSLEDLEQELLRIAVLIIRSDERYSIEQAPAFAFNHLAENLRACSVVFESASIFYLLDDVSTRYLKPDNIWELISALLFQSTTCAFKFTSERQTIDLWLQSPGRNHPIQIGRDVSVFDLGEDVFNIISGPGSAGKDFIARILQLRAGLHDQHPRQRDPRVILGDVSLEQIATEIASLSDESRQEKPEPSEESQKEKKYVYRGLSCLTNVCVGDIGDVIKIYEDILNQHRREHLHDFRHANAYPIDARIQSECFQNMSTRRLYDLNRRDGYFMNHALAFAQTAHDLLVRSHQDAQKKRESVKQVQSHQDAQKNVTKKSVKSGVRLRQYSSIYVKVTAGDENSQQQLNKLRDLIDAGVFVYAGGAHRTKTKGSDPFLQFILRYRKIYGLASFIGLADRDRFELSGDDLNKWLNAENEEVLKNILQRNQINDKDAETEIPSNVSPDSDSEPQVPVERTAPKQYELFDVPKSEIAPPEPPKVQAINELIKIDELSLNELVKLPVGAALVGLGFEERTLESNKSLSAALRDKKMTIHAIEYSLKGHAEEILEAWEAPKNKKVVKHSYDDALAKLPGLAGLALVDISGLAKPLIFKAVRSELVTKGRVLVCHASAEQHYPIEEDLDRVLNAAQSENPIEFIEKLAELLKGEYGPYKDIKLLDDLFDPTRNRALIAFASPKHERLFSLLDRREYDRIEIITPDADTSHAKVATYAAEFICQNYPNASVTRIEINDLLGLVKYLDAKYLEIYFSGGANFELGLTGTKTQALAAAVLSSVRKVSQAWYLSPSRFDEKRFSTGVGKIRVYDICIPGRCQLCDRARLHRCLTSRTVCGSRNDARPH